MPPYLSPAPGACSNSCPLSWWCHPTIWSSVISFSWLQSFPESGSFLRRWFFAAGGQSIGISVSASVLPMNIQDWFLLGLTGLISLQSKGLSKSFLQDPQFKSINSLVLSFLYYPTLTSIHDYICDFYIHTWLLDNTFLKLYILVTDYCSGYNLICFQRQHYITIASCSYFINFTSNDSHITLSLPSEFKEDQKFFWDPPRYNKSVSVLRVTLFGLVKLEKSFGSQRLVMLSFEFSQSHFFP